MSENTQKLSFVEKAGYSTGDAAANFVFMSMVLFQGAFYASDYGLSASAAAAMLLWPRLWDAAFDPIMGVLADRTKTRWGRFRPWVLWTSLPWAICMVLAYTTPDGWSVAGKVAWAGITNTILMTLYSMNNMPYSALGGVMTGDLNERTKLNSYRFVAANIAQFIVGGFTLPLVAKFAEGSSRQHGWQAVMAIWAVICFLLFLVTFFTTRERIQPLVETTSSPKQDFTDLLRNGPWWALIAYTLFHFGMLVYRGNAHYNYYHHYADKAAMFDFLAQLGLTTANPQTLPGVTGAIFDGMLGYIAHGTRESLPANVADVYNSIVNMTGTGTTIICIILSAGFSKRWGRKNVALVCFSLAAVNAFAMYLLPPTATGWMAFLAVSGSVVYAPTCAIMWAMYADAADYSEWQTGRRFTGMVFATIGFALKSGLALGGAAFLWVMVWLWDYDTKLPDAAAAVAGYRASSSLIIALFFVAIVLCVACCKLNKGLTLQMAAELEERRKKAASA